MALLSTGTACAGPKCISVALCTLGPLPKLGFALWLALFSSVAERGGSSCPSKTPVLHWDLGIKSTYMFSVPFLLCAQGRLKIRAQLAESPRTLLLSTLGQGNV